MKTSIFAIAFLFFLSESFSQNYKKDAAVIMNSQKLSELIPNSLQVEILAGGFEWTEGPLWLLTENKLIFSDIPKNSIFEWTEKEGIKLYLKPSGYTGKKKKTMLFSTKEAICILPIHLMAWNSGWMIRQKNLNFRECTNMMKMEKLPY